MHAVSPKVRPSSTALSPRALCPQMNAVYSNDAVRLCGFAALQLLSIVLCLFRRIVFDRHFLRDVVRNLVGPPAGLHLSGEVEEEDRHDDDPRDAPEYAVPLKH